MRTCNSHFMKWEIILLLDTKVMLPTGRVLRSPRLEACLFVRGSHRERWEEPICFPSTSSELPRAAATHVQRFNIVFFSCLTIESALAGQIICLPPTAKRYILINYWGGAIFKKGNAVTALVDFSKLFRYTLPLKIMPVGLLTAQKNQKYKLPMYSTVK